MEKFSEEKKGKDSSFKGEESFFDGINGVNNLTRFSIKSDLLRRCVEVAFKEEKKNSSLQKQVSIALVKKEKMKELSRIYRGKDYATDVLSFFYNEKGFLGEIIVCPEKIKEEKGDSSIEKEVCRVIIHGAFHLLGYKHETEKEEKVMEEKTEKCLKKVTN